jgi:ubiquinone/menaquinone biosynthesis C-methylase UbiE
LHPASYTGLDLNPAGVDFCRKKHKLPGLDFVQGNVEDLPFADQSFDAVINVEASHLYFRFPRFLAEVARVLRPGGISFTPISAFVTLSPNGRRS